MPKQLSAWEQRLATERDRLTVEIAETEKALAATQDAAHGRLAGLPKTAKGYELVEESVLERIPKIEAKLGVQRRALAEIEVALAAAPQLVKVFQQTLPPLAHAIEVRDRAMGEAAQHVEAFLKVLLRLRKTNQVAVARLTEAMRAWGAAGHLADEMPQFTIAKWPAELRRWLREYRAEHGAVPFVDIELRDDQSNPLARAYPPEMRSPENADLGNKPEDNHE